MPRMCNGFTVKLLDNGSRVDTRMSTDNIGVVRWILIGKIFNFELCDDCSREDVDGLYTE